MGLPPHADQEGDCDALGQTFRPRRGDRGGTLGVRPGGCRRGRVGFGRGRSLRGRLGEDNRAFALASAKKEA